MHAPRTVATVLAVAAAALLALAGAAHAKSEYAVFAVSAEGHGGGAWLNPAPDDCAVADGYQMFMPNVKTQRVYHFTNYRNAFLEAIRFDASKPTSLLYQRDARGQLELIGAMYSAPRRMRAGRLDGRIPLSIGRWHKHVNWCLPQKGDEQRWLERRDSLPVFGPESPIATRAACENAGGRFHENLFGWMIHANVFLGEDLQTVFGHGH